ncbi:E1-E2 ATPase domain-containing protein [Trichoderma novae-zelandiae]
MAMKDVHSMEQQHDNMQSTSPSPTETSTYSSKPKSTNGGLHGESSRLEDIQQQSTSALQPDPGEEHLFDTENSPFAFSPGQLGKLINPKSIAAFIALGGLAGLEKGLQSDRRAGLSVEDHILEPITFEQATSASSPPSPLRNLSPSQSTGKPSNWFADRKRIFGENRLPERKSKSFFQLAWIALHDHILILLSVAAIVSLALGLYQTFGQTKHEGAKVEWVEGVAIIVAIAVVVIVGALNDWQKERQFQKLNQKKEDRSVKVIRSGNPMAISVYEVVVGDVMLVEPGDVIPVDGIFIEGHGLNCDESSATGESDLVRKAPADDVLQVLLHEAAPDLDKLDPFIISGARVLDGVGSFLVTSVGQNSSHGRTMMSLREDTGLTPL